MRNLILTVYLSILSLLGLAQKQAHGDLYMLRIYHCQTMDQVTAIESYAGTILKPYLHKQGIPHIGIFMPIQNDTLQDKKLMVWIPLRSMDQLTKLESAFETIDPWGKDPMIQLKSEEGRLPYQRIEISLSRAFRFMTRYDAATSFKRGPDNVYEYRSYESSTEAMHLNKVHMFNEGGEIPLFKRLDFNALFYARVIAGARMPNLIYMTRFEDMNARTAHWKAFVDDPAWKQMVADPKYQGNVSRNETILMKASPLSDL